MKTRISAATVAAVALAAAAFLILATPADARTEAGKQTQKRVG